MKHNSSYSVPSYAAQAFAAAFVAISTEIAAATLGARIGDAMGTHSAIVGKRQSDADGRTLADAVDQALAAGTLGEDGAL